MTQSMLAKRTRLCEASCFDRLSVGAVVGSTSLLRDSRHGLIDATRNRCQEAPKSTPGLQNRPSEVQKSSQDLPGGSRSVPRASQERPRASQERPKSAQERPKSAPRASKSAPRAPKSAPRAAQERPETPQRAFWARF